MQNRLLIFAIWFLFIPTVAVCQNSQLNTWENTIKNKQGQLTIYWYESKPFIYQLKSGEMQGIEYEIIVNFQKFVKQAYGINLEIQWIESKDFGEVMNLLKDSTLKGIAGASALSITAERSKYIDFTNPYMSDISVLISSKNLPIVKSEAEFNQLFSKLTAITIKETTYDADLLRIKRERNIPFKIKYISSSENVLTSIAKTDSSFGFIDLPVYLMYFKQNPNIEIQRQNLFPIKRVGYAFALPKHSDWQIPLNKYLSSEYFKSNNEEIFNKYLDAENYLFIESLSIYSGKDEDVVLLTREKQIQNEKLLGKNIQIRQETLRRNYLIVIASVVFLSLVVFFLLYRKLKIDHHLVIDQKKKIELQAENIELQNVQLENRNKRLSALNEEKNHLIKILAHDLRSPISHVEGLSQLLLLKGDNLKDEQKKHLNLILNASLRLNKMISNILDVDAIENERINIFLEKIEVVETTKNILETFERSAQLKNIKLHFLPLESISYIKADMLLYTEIIENLISNAIKFSPPDKSIFVSVKEENGWVTTSIKDEGPGLSNEDKLLVFRKFQKLSAKPTAGEQSTGLGLSIVKKYTELMYGKIKYDSVFGEGTRFSVQFEVFDEQNT